MSQPHVRCVLVSPSASADWEAYHRIRRTVLFERRGLVGVYDPDRPDEHTPEHFPKLLVCAPDYVGVVRIDLAGDNAYLRRAAIDEPWQRRGFGRELIRLAESFAIERGARRMQSDVAADAVGFYEKCGYARLPVRSSGPSVPMWKDLA